MYIWVTLYVHIIILVVINIGIIVKNINIAYTLKIDVISFKKNAYNVNYDINLRSYFKINFFLIYLLYYLHFYKNIVTTFVIKLFPIQ